MQNSYNDIILTILDIVNYQDDKKLFVKEFVALNILDAMGNLIPKLPSKMQNAIRACGDDPQKMRDLIPEDEFKKEFTKVSQETLAELLKTVVPTVNAIQKEKLAAFVS